MNKKPICIGSTFFIVMALSANFTQGIASTSDEQLWQEEKTMSLRSTSNISFVNTWQMYCRWPSPSQIQLCF